MWEACHAACALAVPPNWVGGGRLAKEKGSPGRRSGDPFSPLVRVRGVRACVCLRWTDATILRRGRGDRSGFPEGARTPVRRTGGRSGHLLVVGSDSGSHVQRGGAESGA